MKDLQQKIISIGLVVIILMGVFPPWKESLKTINYQQENPRGYGFIFYSPSPSYHSYSVSLDFSRLLLQWVVVILVAGLFIFITRKGIK